MSASCDNVSALPVTVQNLTSSVDTFDSCLCALKATAGLEVGGKSALSRNTRRNQNMRNGANGGNCGSRFIDIPSKFPGDVGGIKCNHRYNLAKYKPPPSPTSSESALELNLWTGITKPLHTLYALIVVAQVYLPRWRYQERCAIHTSHSLLWFFVALV